MGLLSECYPLTSGQECEHQRSGQKTKSSTLKPSLIGKQCLASKVGELNTTRKGVKRKKKNHLISPVSSKSHRQRSLDSKLMIKMNLKKAGLNTLSMNRNILKMSLQRIWFRSKFRKELQKANLTEIAYLIFTRLTPTQILS